MKKHKGNIFRVKNIINKKNHCPPLTVSSIVLFRVKNKIIEKFLFLNSFSWIIVLFATPFLLLSYHPHIIEITDVISVVDYSSEIESSGHLYIL